MKTEADVMILESLNDGEEFSNSEGDAICKILRLCGKRPEYQYVKTKHRLDGALKLANHNKLRYLHISAHGEKTGIHLTDEGLVKFSVWSDMIAEAKSCKRVFTSSCWAADITFAKELFQKSSVVSLVGSPITVDFDKAAALWAAFYVAIFNKKQESMSNSVIRSKMKGLAKFFEIPLIGFFKPNNSKHDVKWYLAGEQFMEDKGRESYTTLIKHIKRHATKKTRRIA